MLHTSLFPIHSSHTCFNLWLHTAQQHTEETLQQYLIKYKYPNNEPAVLYDAMCYAVLNGGKRIRPLLALAAGELCGASPISALTVGCAIELIHAYSLVHDDMPCMDNDCLRRGKPTVHIKYGESCALLVGDALQSAAFELLTQPLAGINSATAIKMIRILASHAGANGMVGGQQLDLLAEKSSVSHHQISLDLEGLKQLHQKKTGALFSASIQLGGLSGYKYDYDPPLTTALTAYSHAIGLGFQITDDILDYTSNIAVLGKTPGKDLIQGKSTYVSLLGIEHAKIAAQDCLNNALIAIEPYKESATRLIDLANLIIKRTF